MKYQSNMLDTNSKEIRAVYIADSIRVYQAFNSAIALEVQLK